MRVEPGELDLDVFEQRVAAGRDALSRADPGQAAVLLRGAESLWRGRPLADLEFEPFARFEIQRLEAQRLLAAEDRIEAELALGQHGALCPELEQLVAEHPLRERLRGQLMLALYRSGRQAEALAVFHDTRRVLDAELGIEPGPALRQVHEQVLAADPLLDLPTPAGAAATRTLPRDIAAFTGRERELAQLLDGIDRQAASGAVVGIHAIDGMAGIGKTTLAVHAAHRLAAGFPDGQYFLPLHGHTRGQRPVDPADALASLLLTAGLAPQQIPPGVEARAASWRDHLAGKRILLLLDDAVGHEQVRPLLPGTAGSLVLITSRRRLTALADAAAVSLDVLPPDEAAALLVRLAGRPGLGAGDTAVREITRLGGYLPLAIGMLASQLRHHPAWEAGRLADGLAAAKDRLVMMHAENLSVATAFDLSYADLMAAQQRLFRRLGLVPGPDFDAHAAAALDGIRLDQARRGLEELYDRHLIGEPAPGRYRLHDLLREHARTIAAADDPADRDAATGRLLDYYLHTALAASKHIASTSWNPAVGSLPPARLPEFAPPVSTPLQAAAWLETERANLHAATGYAAASERPMYAALIPAAMANLLEARGHWDQALTLHLIALTAARRAGDQPSQARALMLLGAMQVLTGDFASALTTLQQALAVYRDLGDRAGEADAIGDLGFVHGQTGNYPAATACHQQALELFRDLGDQYGQADALINVGTVRQLTGNYRAAAASLHQVMVLNRDLNHRSTQAWILNERGVLKRLTGDYQAAACHQQALELFRDLGERSAQAHALNELGLVQQLTGDLQGAAASHHQALRLYRDLGDRHGQACVLNSLGELASRTAETHQARDQHGQACAIAQDIGVPFEEARALEGMGDSHLRDGNPGEGIAHLKQALAIYQRIGTPGAQRVQETLSRYGLPLTPAQPAHD
jgi:tetratricopeptide (TPR) repeat protein